MSIHVVFETEQTGGYLSLMDMSRHSHNLPLVSITGLWKI